MGAGSTYLRVAKSRTRWVSGGFEACVGIEVKRTLLAVDLGLRVEIQTQDDHVGCDVQAAHKEEHIRVVEGNLLGQLHHHHDDGQIGSVGEDRSVVVHISSFNHIL
jgi:hypothetical protein